MTESDTNKSNSLFGAIGGFFSKGWDLVCPSSKATTDEYATLANMAREKLSQPGISRRERRYWTKQLDKAQQGLNGVHTENGNIFVRVVTGMIAGGLLVYNIINNHKS